ncbi:glucan biosynthesis protein [Methylocapsa polymorpha]|uniref:Glucan biosynthesis protein n=1 Tax=Methylocapsa polymorpha TaxID=3080828 RepID=A0ABZ0HS71_9HYPH|nr:glucan biosynthesis protein [Methylocapsa sp. RX1]
MVQRREVLKLALGGVAFGQSAGLPSLIGATALAQTAPPSFGLSEPSPFDPGMVTEAARSLSKQAFKAPSADIPEPFRNLNYEQYVGIRQRPGAAIWASENVGFALEPLHRGFIFSTPMQLNIVTGGEARRIVYDPSLFEFGKLSPPANLGDIGFSGFRVLAAQDGGDFSELANFQGASFFRAVARGQNLGAMARAISIKTADPRGEEFPALRGVWIERPTLAANALVVHALIDSESVTGAFRFTIRPVEATIIDAECTLFARVAVDNFGLATMSATHLSGAIDDRRRAEDLRPNVSEVGGVQMLTGKGEWLWRPVSNRDTLQISTFVDENPRGFGFLQRDRNFDHYQDDDQHWESRPSVWIEPIGDWSFGGIQLIEIPSDSEVNDNIIAYWKPQQPLAAGSETAFAYRQFWCWSPPERPALAITAQSLEGRGSSPKRRRFIVEFAGDILSQPQNAENLKPNLSASPGTITSLRTFASADKASCRVLFELDFGGESSSELRLVIEAAGKPISETWIYRWTP